MPVHEDLVPTVSRVLLKNISRAKCFQKPALLSQLNISRENKRHLKICQDSRAQTVHNHVPTRSGMCKICSMNAKVSRSAMKEELKIDGVIVQTGIYTIPGKSVSKLH